MNPPLLGQRRRRRVDFQPQAPVQPRDQFNDGLRNRFNGSPPSQFTAPYTPVVQNRYRRASDTYVCDQDGIAQVWNGIDPVKRFDPSVGIYENAGVVAPTTAVTMSSRGAGDIVGDYFAYLRFVDRSGNFSSFSPIGPEFTASSGLGTVSGATNASPIVLTVSNAGALSAGQVVKVTGVLGNTNANGIYAASPLTSSTIALYLDPTLSVATEGNGTYASGGVLTTGVGTIIYTNLAVSTESKVTRRQILRNKDGDTSVFYIDIDTTDLTSPTLESNTNSDSLLTGVALEDVNGLTNVDKTVPPNYKKFACAQGGRIFAAGNEAYSEGAVVMTSGSVNVTGIGTEWGSLTFANRFLEVVGGDKLYEIESCPSATSLTLTTPYAGTTNPYAYYTIRTGDGERRTIYWSEPGESEAWPLENTLTLSEDPGAGELSALVSYRSYLYILSEYRMYKFSWVDEPILDGFAVPAAKRGCVNNKCWVNVEEICYMMDALGFHAFAGNDDTDIGSPAVQDLFRTKPTSGYKVNWSAKRTFHAVYDPGEAVIRWFIALSGCYTPFHAVCYHIRLKRWWIEEYPWPVGCSWVGRMNGKPQVFIGTTGNRVMAMNQSTLDGMGSIETVRSTVTASGVDWIEDSTATFQPSNLAANPVVIVRGKGKGQRRIITSISGARINVKEPWTDRPDTTSVYQLGGVQWHWTSGWMRWADADYQSTRAISLHFRPLTNEAECTIKVFRDLSATAQSWSIPSTFAKSNGICNLAQDPDTDLAVDTTKYNGYVVQIVSDFRDWYSDAQRYAAIEVSGTQNDAQQSFYRILVEGANQ